jgi:hypothetical protein
MGHNIGHCTEPSPSVSFPRSNLPNSPGVQLDRVGKVGEDGVERLGVPVVEEDADGASGPDPASEHRDDLRLDLEPTLENSFSSPTVEA